jgi:aminoglycoside 3-N-acetyltransferase
MTGADKNILIRHLKALGLGEGDWVAVHSSMKSIGWVQGGPVEVIEALIQTVAPDGVVMMPLFVIPDEQPIDLAVKPTYLGLLPETFRRYPGVVRSLHPTHSVGIYGPGAHQVAESHRNSTYIGRGSPYHQLALNGGWVLHVGTDFNSGSIIHLAEVLAEVPYLDISYPRFEKVFVARAADGSTVKAEPREIPADSKMFYLVQEEMDRRGLLRKGLIGQAPSILARAAEILDVAVEMMRENPWQFLCDFPYCSACRESERLKNRTAGLAPGEKEVFDEQES